MDKVKNQMGIATLEIILVTAIIGILATVVVPKMSYIVGQVALNYELKRLYSELNFARSIGKISDYRPSVMANKVNDSREPVFLRINRSANKYELRRSQSGAVDLILNQHKLQNGITFANKNSENIKFDNPSRFSSGISKITLQSKFGEKSITFDSVGRWYGQ